MEFLFQEIIFAFLAKLRSSRPKDGRVLEISGGSSTYKNSMLDVKAMSKKNHSMC